MGVVLQGACVHAIVTHTVEEAEKRVEYEIAGSHHHTKSLRIKSVQLVVVIIKPVCVRLTVCVEETSK